MALPAHLAQFDGLVGLIADVIAREIEHEAEMETPAGSEGPAGVGSTAGEQDDQEHGKHRMAAARAAS